MDAQTTFSCSLTQSDLGPLAELPSLPPWPAQKLLPQERRDLAVQVLAGAQPVSDLAREHEVSRKFLYQQAHTAEEALSEAFAPSSRPDDVLFYLPVTKTWLRQLVLALVLICHSSVRGVVELLQDVFDYRLSVGTVHNIVHSAVTPAQAIHRQYDLSRILVGLLDEIFQASDPVFVGVDAKSTFCFLLSQEQHRDADTWGIRLLELVDQGFAPEANVADFGAGLRVGHTSAVAACGGGISRNLSGTGSAGTIDTGRGSYPTHCRKSPTQHALNRRVQPDLKVERSAKSGNTDVNETWQPRDPPIATLDPCRMSYA